MRWQDFRLLCGLIFTVLVIMDVPAVPAAQVKDSLDVVADTNKSAVTSQKKIDDLSRQAKALLEEYRRLQDGTEYEEAYARELQELDSAQREQIEDLQQQIARARITRQRIVPLMRSMADALEKFVVLDLPFHHEDRINAVLVLKRRLNQADLSVSAKFRLLLEAYQLEQDYNGTIESWRGPLNRGGEEVSVEYLRVGRTALYYQSLDGSSGGYWDQAGDEWLPLQGDYSRGLAQAMRVAKNLSAPQLLQLPVLAPGATP